MTHPLFTKHEAMLDKALSAIETRGYWSPFAEMPSPKVYGETANADGEAAFKAHLGKTFELDQPSTGDVVGEERSPFGTSLDVKYPKADPDALVRASQQAQQQWRAAGPQAWVGVSLEILSRLNRASFEIGYSVMHTTGQAFMMAFQAGGPHAQDRALEAVVYAWDQLRRIPAQAHWEKPQGKNPPLAMQKRFTIVPRGTGLVLGCCTFPTWNGYPGLFASLATGNAVLVKPHPRAVLPLALTVQVAREVLAGAGFDPNLVALAAEQPGEGIAKTLATRPEIRIIDYTGSTSFGDWLEANARQAQVYTEKAGVNTVLVDSTANYKGMLSNLAFSLSLYSGQMCTTPQNLLIPRDGIRTDEGPKTFDEVAADLARSVDGLLGDDARANALLGAIVNPDVKARLEAAAGLGEVALASREVANPEFPDAVVRTPVIVKLDGAKPDDEAAYMSECFGPVSFAVAVDSAADAVELLRRTIREKGAMTVGAYTTDDEVERAVQEVCFDEAAQLSLNLTGGVYVNQTAAFSDFHGSGGNPAANAALTDGAFVANRFRVVEVRREA